jgi:rhamnosyltransferase
VSRPLVSILLPTKNAMRHLPALLDRIAAQQVSFSVEIVAIDSGSTDGTAAFLGPRIDRLIQISAETFNHGLTRNQGIASCRGDLVVMLVQDALPESERWLGELVLPLQTEQQVAGTFARQVPRPGASAITRLNLDRYVASGEEPRRSAFSSPENLLALPPREQYLACVFDNVCSCIRRSVWQAHPFVETPIAEDLAWAKEVLQAGHAIVYAPRAVVIHSHDRSVGYELRRTILVHQRLYDLFGLRTIETPGQLTLAIGLSTASHLRCLASGRQGLGEMARALGLAWAWPVGQYLGALSQKRGWRFLSVGGA